MSQYTTDDILRLIEEAYNRGELLKLPEGADLRGIDLGRETIQKKLAEWRAERGDPEGYPPWCSRGETGGVNLAKAILNKVNLQGAQLQGADLYLAQLQGAVLREARLQAATLSLAKLQGADLWGAQLQGAILGEAQLQEAKLQEANLRGAQLLGANLSLAQLQGANLRRAQLQGAYLGRAQLQGADLWGAQLQGVHLARAEWDEKTKLEDADWGNLVLGDELAGDFAGAQSAYRRLKRWYSNNGQYDLAGEFFYREMEARRKDCGPGTGFKAAEVGEALRQVGKALRRSLWPPPFLWKGWPAALGAAWRRLHRRLWPRRPLSWLGLELYRFLYGYGERPLRVLWWLLGLVVLVPALAYWLAGVFPDFWSALYFSAASSVALGYGGWVQLSAGWAKGMGVGQTFIGAFLLALFLVTFVRKMSPR